VLKDRMYTFAPTGVERRSAQTTLWRIAEALVRLVAPVLSFTAEEVWGYLPQVEGREASVHLALFPQPAATNAADPKEWAEIFAVRDEALRSLEEARQAKRIGKALEAKLIVHAPAELLALLTRDREGLKELFNVSQVELQAADRLQVETLPADGQKCGRCWNYRTDIEPYGPWPEVCGRCAEALETMGYARTSGILEERSA
jgi:isoleucyl-tRNA synthetase